MPIKLKTIFREAASTGEDARWLRWLDAEVFPDDSPFTFPMANWIIGWRGREGVAYCGWKPVLHGGSLVGFHYRAGVLKGNRGAGYQKIMLGMREKQMWRQGITRAVTYTSADNVSSMRSLITAGYRPYVTTNDTHLAENRSGFVHWGKDL